jgi:hypothetical protein
MGALRSERANPFGARSASGLRGSEAARTRAGLALWRSVTALSRTAPGRPSGGGSSDNGESLDDLRRPRRKIHMRGHICALGSPRFQ